MNIGSLITSLQKGTLKNVLTGAGIGLATSSVSYLAFQQAVNAVKSQAYGLGGDIIAILHIAGFDVFFSTILAAIVTSLSLNASKLSLTKMTK
ncbi:hypothetical protein BJD20_20030 [Acinetobacter proteolyticus]|uniref:DUF2523 family protein n=1 Tax=Acinetobacter proteolyticus TaxID=1776741 RepID=UPI0008632B66|nr:DUF2523 family protein [Acinetobacter proteolyticus]OEY93803.1 hypothetical protein BJD20_20030 [Acinetobacter proteolyticus]